ncbi:Chemotaxis protein cheY [Geobacillus sp. WSUCF1]|nr:Chemotaxis protein cheY [Geobacillus sp. WSUCF1]
MGLRRSRKLKKIDSNAKVIMCSAMGQQAMVIDAIQAGAKDFVVKPFQADRVIEAINKTIG